MDVSDLRLQADNNAMDIEAAGFSESKSTCVEAPNFDLDSYISRYIGFAKISRLLFIAEKCPGVSDEAFKAAIDELKRGNNTGQYNEVMKKVGDKLGPGYTFDGSWVEAVNRRAQQTLEKLEMDLNSSKTNLIKESIRMGYHEMGDFWSGRGDYGAALKCYMRTRDYCTTNRHSIDMCLAIIRTSLALGQYINVSNYVVKAEHTADRSDPVVMGQLHCAAGLERLQVGQYRAAALRFLEVPAALASNFNEVMSPEDVACYGGLCAAAALPRDQLQTMVLDNAEFKGFLELVPQLRELLLDLRHSRYGSCLSRLAALRQDHLDLDPYLGPHIDKLQAMIRESCLCQYFTPYLSVRLGTMGEAFGVDRTQIEKEVANLIVANRIQARIDSQSGTLHMRQTNQRKTSFNKVLEMSRKYRQEVRCLLLRMSCLQHGFAIRSTAADTREAPPPPMDFRLGSGMWNTGGQQQGAGGADQPAAITTVLNSIADGANNSAEGSGSSAAMAQQIQENAQDGTTEDIAMVTEVN